MRVLGVDPGLTRCGVGVVEGRAGRRADLVAVGVLRTAASDEPASRLLALETELTAWIERHRPDAVAVERVFAQANVRTVMGTAQAAAVAMTCAARAGLPLALHTPSEVKAAVSGSGRADKAQVGHMVARLLGLDEAPRPADAADALALALCHLWRGGAQRRQAEALAAARATGRATSAPAAPPAGATSWAEVAARGRARRAEAAARAGARPGEPA